MPTFGGSWLSLRSASARAFGSTSRGLRVVLVSLMATSHREERCKATEGSVLGRMLSLASRVQHVHVPCLDGPGMQRLATLQDLRNLKTQEPGDASIQVEHRHSAKLELERVAGRLPGV